MSNWPHLHSTCTIILGDTKHLEKVLNRLDVAHHNFLLVNDVIQRTLSSDTSWMAINGAEPLSMEV